MNITFLIGNGFDLNLGLKTKFSDFLGRYKNNFNEDNELIQYFKSNILYDEELWANAEIAFGKATKKFKDDNYTAEDFCTCHEDFCINLAKYLDEENEKIDYNNLSSYLSKGFVQGILNHTKGFREEEREVIEKAENIIGGGYTFNFVNFNYTQTLDWCISATLEKQNILGSRTHNHQTYSNHIGKVIHAHGTTKKDLVLGVNDTTQISDISLFTGYDDEFLNEIIKQKTNEINQENTELKVSEILNKSDLIYIYGMSIGYTDKLWWKKICELMIKNQNLHVIIHRYDAPEDGLIRRTFRMFSKNARKEFSAYYNGKKELRAEIESRIHIDRSNIFQEINGLVSSNSKKKEEMAIK